MSSVQDIQNVRIDFIDRGEELVLAVLFVTSS